MLLVPGRPSARGLLFWTLTEGPLAPTVAIRGGASAPPAVVSLPKAPGDRTPYHAHVVAAGGLDPDTAYVLTADGGGGRAVERAARTLPDRLPQGRRVTVALGSCYSLAQDAVLASSFPPPPNRSDGPDPVLFKILCGDQIYLDLSPRTGLPILTPNPDPWTRYPRQWLDPRFRAFLECCPNLVVADDHEYWNDYPHANAWQLFDYESLGPPCDEAYAVYQASFNLDPHSVDRGADPGTLLSSSGRSFALDLGGIPFFLLDTRTGRARYDDPAPVFAKTDWLKSACQWLAELTGPGVLVLSQPAVESRAKWLDRLLHTMGDNNLPDYPMQFASLWDALLGAPHDVLVLSGDIHWSRNYAITGADPARSVYEVISSPLARIPRLPFEGRPDTGRQDGKVVWEGRLRSARWSRIDALAEDSTYATLTFERKADSDGAPIDVEVNHWKATDGARLGPVRLSSKTIALR